MLVCSVVARPQRTVAAILAEAGAALDNTGTLGLGQLVQETASAADVAGAQYIGLAAVAETAGAVDTSSATLTFAGVFAVSETASAASVENANLVTAAAVTETATAGSAQDGSTALASAVTWDAATVSNVTLSGGNLVATNTNSSASFDQGAHVAAADGRTAGKYYFEITITTTTTMGSNMGVGIGTPSSTYTNLGIMGQGTTGDILLLNSGDVYSVGSFTGVDFNHRSAGDVIGMAVDLGNRKMWFRVAPSGDWNTSGTANPATNSGGVTIPSGTMVPFCLFGGGGDTPGNVLTANFGATAFTGTAPSGFTGGWPAGIAGTVSEAASAAATPDGTIVVPSVVAGSVTETATATDTPDGSVGAFLVPRSAMAGTVFVNSDGTARQANADGVMVNL